ncbi:MAG: hypothetical protein V4502_13225 [Pseudomonadota bacterium]
MSVRLINRTEVLTQLLAAVTAVPAGVKLSIPQLRDALVSQADVLSGLQILIKANEIDRATLRPLAKQRSTNVVRGAPSGTGRYGDDEAAAPLVEAIGAFLERSAMSGADFARDCLRSKSALPRYRRPGARVRSATARRIRAFIADHDTHGEQSLPPAVAEAPRAGCGEAKAQAKAPASPPVSASLEAASSGPELWLKLMTFISDHDLATNRVAVHLFNGKAAINRLKKTGVVRFRTVEKVLAFIATPPPEELKRLPRHRPSHGKPRAPEHTRPSRALVYDPRFDPTRKPVGPGLEVADKVRRKSELQSTNIRREQVKEATRLLDAGVDPSDVKSTFQGNLMRQIERRRADEARLADPVSSAQLFLQRRGYRVYRASVEGGQDDRFVVGNKAGTLSEAELVKLARQKGFGQ